MKMGTLQFQCMTKTAKNNQTERIVNTTSETKRIRAKFD